MTPREASAVEGVAVAVHARLVAVVDARRTGQRKLQKSGHPQQLERPLARRLVHMPLCKLRAVGVRRVDQRRQRAGRIVCGQDIHDRAEHIRRIILSNGHDPLSQRLATVLAAHIAQDRLLPRVVHDGIELAAGEVPAADVVRDLVGGVLPDLADQDCLRIQLPQAPAQPLNEGVRQLIDHIQPEAVRAQPQPVRQNAVLVVNDVADVAFV